MSSVPLLSGVTAAPTTGATLSPRAEGAGAGWRGNMTFYAEVVGTGAVSATVIIEVSNGGAGFVTIGTITLSGTSAAYDGFAVEAPWDSVRARLTAISGTGATVNVNMGV